MYKQIVSKLFFECHEGGSIKIARQLIEMYRADDSGRAKLMLELPINFSLRDSNVAVDDNLRPSFRYDNSVDQQHFWKSLPWQIRAEGMNEYDPTYLEEEYQASKKHFRRIFDQTAGERIVHALYCG